MRAVFILAAILAPACSGAGNEKGKGGKDAGEPVVEASHFADANAVLAAKCSQEGCHGTVKSGSFVLVDAQATVDAQKASIRNRILLHSVNGVMPPPGYPALTEAERKTLLGYVGAGADAGAASRPEAARVGLHVDPMVALQELGSYPSETKILQKLAAKMHLETAECAGFGAEERAELETFAALSEAVSQGKQSVQEARQAMQPVLDAVRNAVVPKLLEALEACRLAQRETPNAELLDALMQACFGLQRAAFSEGPGGSTPYGDPLRLPAPELFRATPECQAAGASAARNL